MMIMSMRTHWMKVLQLLYCLPHPQNTGVQRSSLAIIHACADGEPGDDATVLTGLLTSNFQPFPSHNFCPAAIYSGSLVAHSACKVLITVFQLLCSLCTQTSLPPPTRPYPTTSYDSSSPSPTATCSVSASKASSSSPTTSSPPPTCT